MLDANLDDEVDVVQPIDDGAENVSDVPDEDALDEDVEAESVMDVFVPKKTKKSAPIVAAPVEKEEDYGFDDEVEEKVVVTPKKTTKVVAPKIDTVVALLKAHKGDNLVETYMQYQNKDLRTSIIALGTKHSADAEVKKLDFPAGHICMIWEGAVKIGDAKGTAKEHNFFERFDEVQPCIIGKNSSVTFIDATLDGFGSVSDQEICKLRGLALEDQDKYDNVVEAVDEDCQIHESKSYYKDQNCRIYR